MIPDIHPDYVVPRRRVQIEIGENLRGVLTLLTVLTFFAWVLR